MFPEPRFVAIELIDRSRTGRWNRVTKGGCANDVVGTIGRVTSLHIYHRSTARTSMEVHSHELAIETDERIEWHIITEDVEAVLAGRDVDAGIVLVRTGHTSAALTTNEPEQNLLEDLRRIYTDLVPPDDWYFHDQHHIDTDTQRNAFGHALSSLIRRPILVPLVDGELQMGTYEEILFLEFDGPRPRTVDVAVLA